MNPMNDFALLKAISALTHELMLVRVLIEQMRLQDRACLVCKHDLDQTEKTIMEAIQTFATRVNTSFAKLGTAVDGVVADVDALKAKIDQLQNAPGTLSPEDQATLDAIETQADQIATKLEALDAATETVPAPQP